MSGRISSQLVLSPTGLAMPLTMLLFFFRLAQTVILGEEDLVVLGLKNRGCCGMIVKLRLWTLRSIQVGRLSG